jgi:hypothetical protein
MTREDSILHKMWVTDDGRYLAVNEIADDHLHNIRSIRSMLCQSMAPGYAQVYAIYWTRAGLTQDEYAAAWLQIIDDEFTRRV